MKLFRVRVAAIFMAGVCLAQSAVLAQQALVIKPLAEKKVTELPAGPLVWRLENFPTLAQAEAAAGSTALVAQSAGKVWLFTLGPAGGAGGRHQGCRGGTDPESGRDAIPAQDQRGEAGPRKRHACAYASGFRGIFRTRRGDEPEDSAWRHAHCGGSLRNGPGGRHADASVEQRRLGPALACDVRGRCRQAVLVASQVPVVRARECHQALL